MDITEKMIYLFQFHWEDVLTADPGIVIQLTGLLLIDNNQLKKEILKTIGSILSTPGVARSIHQTLISELVLLKDILIAICHNEPHGVALEALQLIATHSQELMSDMDRYKIFALMAKQRSPIQQVAKTMFIEYVKSTVKDGQTESRRFLAVLDSLVGRSQVTVSPSPSQLRNFIAIIHFSLCGNPFLKSLSCFWTVCRQSSKFICSSCAIIRS